MILLDDYIYLMVIYISSINNQLVLFCIDFEMGQIVDDCYEGEDVILMWIFIILFYDGFNFILFFIVFVLGIGLFNFMLDNFELLLISCVLFCGLEDCSNGIDDDGDGLVDCEDFDCDCEDIEICDNDIDDDGDGLIDCEDFDLVEDCCCYVLLIFELGNDIVCCENGVVVLDVGFDFELYEWLDFMIG